MQKNIVVLILIILGLAAIFFLAYLLPKIKAAPKIQVETPEYDFGDIPQQKAEKVLRVKNVGAVSLEIKRVSTSCGCTKATIDKTVIEPNQGANLTITFDPTEMGEIGPVEKVVYVRSNDPVNDEIAITIKMNVIK